MRLVSLKQLFTKKFALLAIFIVLSLFAGWITKIDKYVAAQTTNPFYSCVPVTSNDSRFANAFLTQQACNSALYGTVQLTNCSNTCNALDGCLCPTGCAAENGVVIEQGISCGGPSNGNSSCYAKNSNNQCIPMTSPDCADLAANGTAVYSTYSQCVSFTGTSCTTQSQCANDTYCANGQCVPKHQAISQTCSPGTAYSTNGAAGAICCKGGEQECASGSCSAIADSTFGTCLAAVGGPSTGPTEDQCAANGQIRCNGCEGFCGSPNISCNQQSLDRCGEVIVGGSCAVNFDGNHPTYENGSCTRYCTNIPGRDGQQCSNVTRSCQYIGPENPRYDDYCPTGNGYGDFGWNGQCFTDIPDNAIVNSYYCPCENNDCTGVSLGNGCQLNRIAGEACYQTGECGIRQVDIDIPITGNALGDQTQHSSRNMLITSGCSVPPQDVVVPPDDIVIPPSTPNPTSYFCDSTCSTDAQCQTADSRFVCTDTPDGGRCRLNSNPTSNTCQPPVGPQCLSLSLTNISNPTAPATADPELGDAVSFTCGLVNGAQRYIFRVLEPDGTVVNLNATGATSEQYTIDQDGGFAAQCQICTGAADSTCLPYENPF